LSSITFSNLFFLISLFTSFLRLVPYFHKKLITFLSSIFSITAKDAARESVSPPKVPEKNRKLITTHESLGYLESRYGVKVLTTIIPSLNSANEISSPRLAPRIKCGA